MAGIETFSSFDALLGREGQIVNVVLAAYREPQVVLRGPQPRVITIGVLALGKGYEGSVHFRQAENGDILAEGQLSDTVDDPDKLIGSYKNSDGSLVPLELSRHDFWGE